MCLRSLYIVAILWNYIQDSLGSLYILNQNYTLMVVKVGCIVYLAALIVGCLGGSVLKVDISGEVKKIRAASGVGLQVMFQGSICVSGPCTLQLSCGNIYELLICSSPRCPVCSHSLVCNKIYF